MAATETHAQYVMGETVRLLDGPLQALLHPALPLLVAGVVAALAPPRLRKALLVLAPLWGAWNLLGFTSGDLVSAELAGFELILLRVDKLAFLFALLFHLAALLAGIYALHSDDRMQQVAGLLYAGSAVGAVFAGDLLVLFFFWELLAITSVFLIWARRETASTRSGLRYLLVHIASGVLLLIGAALHWIEFGTLVFERMDLGSAASWVLLLAIGIKCCFPLLHTWLVDAYPAATELGTVYLASFTTKTAVYALARGYEGCEPLIWIGMAMAMFPIFYAVIENDLRRVLGYSMINQIGFMVCGVGLGAGLGVNGAVAHAFNDVIFKGLLFMSMGAVLLRTGRINGSELGGLYKTMPQTAGLCMVGAASISAFPLFSGFVSKSMVMTEAAHEGYVVVWLALLFASAGVFHHAGIKIPFFAFFAHDSGLRPKEAPLNMRVAMGIAALLCIAIGCFPNALYALLPYATDYHPYDTTHVVQQLQLLFFSALAFVTLMLTGIYPPELRSTNLDVDWFARRAAPRTLRVLAAVGGAIWYGVLAGLADVLKVVRSVVRWLHSPAGRLGEPWPTGTTVFWAATLLGLLLLFSYLGSAL